MIFPELTLIGYIKNHPVKRDLGNHDYKNIAPTECLLFQYHKNKNMCKKNFYHRKKEILMLYFCKTRSNIEFRVEKLEKVLTLMIKSYEALFNVLNNSLQTQGFFNKNMHLRIKQHVQ